MARGDPRQPSRALPPTSTPKPTTAAHRGTPTGAGAEAGVTTALAAAAGPAPSLPPPQDEDEDEAVLFDALLARIGLRALADPNAPARRAIEGTSGSGVGGGDLRELPGEEAELDDDDDDEALLARALRGTPHAVGATAGAAVFEPFLRLPPADPTAPRATRGASTPGSRGRGGGGGGGGGAVKPHQSGRRLAASAAATSAVAKLAAELPVPKMVHYHLDETAARSEKRRGGK